MSASGALDLVVVVVDVVVDVAAAAANYVIVVKELRFWSILKTLKIQESPYFGKKRKKVTN